MNIDVNTGRITDYSIEYYENYGQAGCYYRHFDYDDDMYD